MDIIKDETVALMRDPYRFISTRCRELNKDVFSARIYFQKTICMTGKDAAELFYSPHYFMRAGSAPEPIKATLFGKGGIQTLDGEAHKHRKKMFISLMTTQNVEQLKMHFHSWFKNYMEKWSVREKVCLYDELQEVLTGAVCSWAGIPLKNSELHQRTREITALFDAAAGTGMRHFWSRTARKNAEHWLEKIVKDTRLNTREGAAKNPLEIISWHRDLDGELMPAHIAAVELLNLIRPTVAVSVFMVDTALALYNYPETYKKLKARTPGYNEMFIQEVRRFYPLFPSLLAKTRLNFTWQGEFFPQGTKVILDLYGTNHDPRIWFEPDVFKPERFKDFKLNPFNFIPQGGGDPVNTHRCPGEWFTIELMKIALDFFVHQMTYNIPTQDLSINWSRLPAIPHSRFIIDNVSPVIQMDPLSASREEHFSESTL